MRNVGNNISDGEKHTVIFEPNVWNKVKVIAEENNMTVSYVINELIKNIDSVENRVAFVFNTEIKGEK